MAVSAAGLGSSASTSNATSYASPSITPTSGRPIIVAVAASAQATAAQPGDLVGAGVAWAPFAYLPSNLTGGVFIRQLQLFRGLPGAGASAGALTFDVGTGQPQLSGCSFSIIEFQGVEASGDAAENMVRQVYGGFTDSSVTSLAITMPLVPLAGSGILFVGQNGAANATDWAPAGGGTEIHEVQYATPNQGLETVFNATATQSYTGTYTTSSRNSGFLVELKATSSPVDPVEQLGYDRYWYDIRENG